MDDLLGLQAKYTNVSKLRIRQFTDIIFLCGGPTAPSESRPQSIRDFFLRRIKDTEPALYERIFLAEKISTWAEDMIQARYTPDLLTFESHVSGLSSAVSLIVESPGSIAELGSFCLLSGVQKRLMVVLQNDMANTKSFISLGPVSYLKRFSGPNRNSIHIYPWEIHKDRDTGCLIPNFNNLDEQADDFIRDLLDFENGLPKHHVWDSHNLGHLSLLISDLINLFHALKITEVVSFFKQIGLVDTNRNTIKSHVFLLEKMNLVVKQPYGATDYYISNTDVLFINWNMVNPPANLRDKKRFQFLTARKIKTTDRNRWKAIQLAHPLNQGS